MSQYFYTLISNGGLLTFLYIIPTVFVALYVREYSRTYAARRMGLLVEEKKGFFKYFSVAGYIVAVLTGMGWGKSSEVRLSGEKKSKRALYHLSGSIANMLLALALVLVEAVKYAAPGLTVTPPLCLWEADPERPEKPAEPMTQTAEAAYIYENCCFPGEFMGENAKCKMQNAKCKMKDAFC